MSRPRFALLAAACVVVGAVDCRAQDDTALKFGPFSIQPSLVVQNIGEDKNVFNEATNPRSDFTMTISPRATVIFHARRLKATLSQNTDYVYFRRYKQERGTNQGNGVRVEADLGILQPFAAATFASSKARINNEVDARARHSDDEYSAGTSVKVFTRTNASIRLRQSQTKFADGTTFRGESLPRAFDGKTQGYDGSVGVALTPLTSLSLILTQEHARFDLAPERNSDTFRVVPTFSFSPLGLLNGSAAFGYRHFKPKDPRIPDFKGFVTQVTAGITAFDNHRFDTTIVRDVTYSYDQAATYYIQNSFSVSWSHVLIGRVDTTLTVGRNLMQYHQTAESAVGPRNDTYTHYAAGLGYRLSRRLRAGANADYQQRRSGLAADRAYKDNRIYGSLTWGG